MADLHFSKLNGQGNDFILLDGVNQEINLTPKQIAFICDRHFGVGADGIIIARKSNKYDFKMDYFNADGSVAEMCGNGIRCMARFLWDRGITREDKMDIETLAGKKSIKIELQGGQPGNIEVNMGQPLFGPEQIPANLKGEDEVFGHKILAAGQTFTVNLVSMGNPHCVIFVDSSQGLKKIDLGKWGPVLEEHPLFPNKINVEFVYVQNKESLDMRVWERGVGQTLACGTGACASAVAAVKLGKIKPGIVVVNLPGGTVCVNWPGTGPVYLKGTANYVFDGTLFNI